MYNININTDISIVPELFYVCSPLASYIQQITKMSCKKSSTKHTIHPHTYKPIIPISPKQEKTDISVYKSGSLSQNFQPVFRGVDRPQFLMISVRALDSAEVCRENADRFKVIKRYSTVFVWKYPCTVDSHAWKLINLIVWFEHRSSGTQRQN